MNKTNKNKAIRLLVWIAIIEAIIIGGMVMAFLSIIIDPIAIAANYENGAEEFAVPVASTPIYAEVEPSRSAYPEPTPSTPIYEEVEEEFVRFPCTDDIYAVANGIPVTYRELHMLGLTIWGEANGQSKMEQAAVAWAILNRVDNADGENFARGRSITYVLQFPGYAPGQIHGYWNTKGARCDDYYLELAKDVVDRWSAEHEGEEKVGRVLPKEYTYWAGKKTNGEWHNYFRTAYKTNEPRWDWSLPNPYVEG